MNKGGVSAIVATVLILLITISAVTLVWVAIIPIIGDNLNFESLDVKLTIIGSEGYSVYDSISETASVQIKRGIDDVNLSGIDVLFSFGGESLNTRVNPVKSGNIRVYYFNLSGYGKPESVEISPVFISGSKESVGDISSDFDLIEGDIPEAGKTFQPLGTEATPEVAVQNSPDDMILWWTFDEDGIDEVSGYEVNLGGEFVSGRENGAYSFQPSGWVSTTFGSSIGEGVSYLFWFRVVGTDMSGTIFCVEDFIDGSLEDDLGMSGSNVGDRNCDDYFIDSSFSISDNDWHFFAISKSENSSLCIDGECVGVGDLSGSIPEIGKITFNGGCGCGFGGFSQGVIIDELMIFDRNLSEEEMNSFY